MAASRALPAPPLRVHLCGLIAVAMFVLVVVMGDTDLGTGMSSCPIECDCNAYTVDCSHRGLTQIPQPIPPEARRLCTTNTKRVIGRESILNNNRIKRIANSGIFKKLSILQELDLRNNEITDIEDDSFSGAHSLADLLITENKLNQIRPEMLAGLKNITNVDWEGKGSLREREPDFDLYYAEAPGSSPARDLLVQFANKKRLEQNMITEVPPKAFAPFKRLTRIDISKNNITRISSNAFSGLKSLSSLFLFGNQITDLPEGLFKGLSSLQLLSLYDNNIQSLADGVFTPLTSIQTLHLGRNPFICDCNLKWLADYLEVRPTLETSEARCEEPKRNARKRISQLSTDKFKCRGMEELRTKYANQCLVDTKCPDNCVCDGTVVDCSKRDLKDIPNDIPTFATEL
ncbi:unnamed protein product [Oppiella nova]|uniref:Uncharacterized protein n=1 Tax=Oppiella nova TaxID=334625 RepID=A0A7R9M2B6_9ACAR|nr:unnamed protein product [Oppiella nova]CAG2168593.1 unnamed protein product [Oppiella nova]